MDTWAVRQSMPTEGHKLGRTRCGGSDQDVTQVRHFIKRGGDHGGCGPKGQCCMAASLSVPLCHCTVAVSCTVLPNVIFHRAYRLPIDGDHVEQWREIHSQNRSAWPISGLSIYRTRNNNGNNGQIREFRVQRIWHGRTGVRHER